MPPPLEPALLPLTVLFVTVTVPPRVRMPPPVELAWLPLTVLFVRVTVPKL
jgi:hypothetical protein